MFSDQEIVQIYNGMKKKDMPFPEFRQRLKASIAPRGLQHDLRRILAGKERQRQIDAALHRDNRNNS